LFVGTVLIDADAVIVEDSIVAAGGVMILVAKDNTVLFSLWYLVVVAAVATGPVAVMTLVWMFSATTRSTIMISTASDE
jgi:hypothetical protein